MRMKQSNESVDITEGFERILQEWPTLKDSTKSKIERMKTYYANVARYDHAFENKKKSDLNEIKKDLDGHEDLAARANGLKRNLETQVRSSRNELERMIKHGKIAAIVFAILCGVIGGSLGAKVPGLGQIVAIVVGVVLGFIVCGGLGMALYFVLKWRAKIRHENWRKVESENEQGVALAPVITKKRSNLSEIRNVLNGIEEDNMSEELVALVDAMANYLKDDVVTTFDINQVRYE